MLIINSTQYRYFNCMVDGKQNYTVAVGFPRTPTVQTWHQTMTRGTAKNCNFNWQAPLLWKKWDILKGYVWEDIIDFWKALPPHRFGSTPVAKYLHQNSQFHSQPVIQSFGANLLLFVKSVPTVCQKCIEWQLYYDCSSAEDYTQICVRFQKFSTLANPLMRDWFESGFGSCSVDSCFGCELLSQIGLQDAISTKACLTCLPRNRTPVQFLLLSRSTLEKFALPVLLIFYHTGTERNSPTATNTVINDLLY